MKIDGDRSKEFEMKVGVHQGLVLSSLLPSVVMDEVRKDVSKDCVKELLYADDLVLFGVSC